MYLTNNLISHYHFSFTEPSSTNPTFGPNFEEFNKRFDPQRTASQGRIYHRTMNELYTCMLRSAVA